MFRAALVGGLFFAAHAVAQPSCPQVGNFQVTPEHPGVSDELTLQLVLTGASATMWELSGQTGSQIRLDLEIGWQGGFGAPQFWTRLDPLPSGEYQVVIAPTIRNVPDSCPPVTLPVTIRGTAGSTPVPAPMLSPPILLTLIVVLGGIGWRALARTTRAP